VFTLAVAIIVVWVVTGPMFGFSDTWQLVINTGTTIITFLMVFLIQNTQNRDTEAIQVKLDELIRATKGAHNALLDLEELEEESLDAFKAKYQALATAARTDLDQGNQDTGTPEPREAHGYLIVKQPFLVLRKESRCPHPSPSNASPTAPTSSRAWSICKTHKATRQKPNR